MFRNESQAILYHDMVEIAADNHISDKIQKGMWHGIPYKTATQEGKMLFGYDSAAPEPLKLRLGLRGYHAIYLYIPVGGLFDVNSPSCRLSRENFFSPTGIDICLNSNRPSGYAQLLDYNLYEGFWKIADMTDQYLEIDRGLHYSGLAGLKFIPLDDAEVDQYKKRLKNPKAKKLLAHNDIYSFLADPQVEVNKETICEMMEPLRNTDISTFVYQVLSPFQVNYPSKCTDIMGSKNSDQIFVGKTLTDIMHRFRQFQEQGIDLLATFLEITRDLGMDFWISLRLGGIGCEPCSNAWTSQFAKDNPECFCKDQQGNKIPGISWMYPKVRKHIHKVIEEMIDYGVDGLMILFVRSMPMVLFEKPFIDLFIEQYCYDPREVDEDDPNILELRGKLVTQYLTEIRELLDNKAVKLNRSRIKFSIEAHASQHDNRFWGYDISALAKNNIIDTVVAQAHMRRPGVPMQTDPDGIDYEYYRDAVKGTNVLFYEDILPRNMTPGQYVDVANKAYAEGCDGLAFWDIETRYALNQWNVIRQLGDMSDIIGYNPETHFEKITSLGGLSVDKYPCWWVY